jgi:hypothetical protein
MRGENYPHKGSTSRRGHHASGRFQLLFRDCIDQITFAECGPVQAISLVQDDFVCLGRPGGPFCRAGDYLHDIPSCRTVGVTDNNNRVGFAPFRRLPHEDFKLLQSSSGRESVILAALAKALSTLSHSGSSGNRLITGILRILTLLCGR